MSAQEIVCWICGERSFARYGGEIGERMVSESSCFSCVYWQRLIELDAKNPDEVVVVKGEHYLIGPEPSSARLRNRLTLGLGGVPFRIRFHDGREVISRNLWVQGLIPEHWRDQLPDNAERIT